MKASLLLLLAFLALTNFTHAQDSEYEYEEVEAEEYTEVEEIEVHDPSLRDNTVVVEISNSGEDSEEVYHRDADGNLRSVQPYRGITLVGASFEHGETGGEGYGITRNGGRLQLSLPVLGTGGALAGGDSVTGANLGRVRIEVGAGQLNTDGVETSYVHGAISPTLGLFFGDQPRVYERGNAQPSIFGVELGPSIGFMCDNMDEETKVELGITADNCHATVGAIFRATISYFNFGVDVRHHIGQEDSNREETEVIFNFGLEIPLSHNTVDSDVDNSDRNEIYNSDDLAPNSVDVGEDTRALSV